MPSVPRRFAASIGGCLLLLSGCAGAPPSARGALLFPEDAVEASAAGTARLIDVRLPRETTDPRVAEPLAARLPFDPAQPAVFVTDMDRLLEGDRRAGAMLICEIGVRSEQARRVLTEAGFLNVSSVDQGYGGWRAAGLALRPANP